MTHTVDARPIRVAHVIQNLNYGGMERVLHGLARDLPGRGFEVHVVVLQFFGRFAEGLEDRATLHRVPAMSPLSFFRPSELAAILQGIAPDLVHTHTGVWLKGVRAGRLAGARTVHTEHGRPDPVPLTDRLIDNWASRWTDAIIAVSDALADVLRTQVVSDPSRVRVITNGVPTDRLRPSVGQPRLRRELGIPDGALVIGSIGRLEPIKNFGMALRAFAKLGDRLPDDSIPWLVLAGDGSDRRALERHAAELGVASRVRFLGWRADAEALYGAFDLFTLTSLSEGTSISLLESMSSGVCPVVTDVGGNRAVLGPELASLLVPTRDEAALTAAWRRQLADPAGRAELGRLARARVQERFSFERLVDQHAAVYRELVERARPETPRTGRARIRR